jgi:hypothetical protein
LFGEEVYLREEEVS